MSEKPRRHFDSAFKAKIVQKNEVIAELMADNPPAADSKKGAWVRLRRMKGCWVPHDTGDQIVDYDKTLKTSCIRPKCPETLEEGRQLVADFILHYNTVRLHSAIGYITPADRLNDLGPQIHSERDRKLAEARERRRLMRQAQADAKKSFA